MLFGEVAGKVSGFLSNEAESEGITMKEETVKTVTGSFSDTVTPR